MSDSDSINGDDNWKVINKSDQTSKATQTGVQCSICFRSDITHLLLPTEDRYGDLKGDLCGAECLRGTLRYTRENSEGAERGTSITLRDETNEHHYQPSDVDIQRLTWKRGEGEEIPLYRFYPGSQGGTDAAPSRPDDPRSGSAGTQGTETSTSNTGSQLSQTTRHNPGYTDTINPEERIDNQELVIVTVYLY